MKFHFIEYVSNQMIPGDWRWYLETYKVTPDGARDWSAQFCEPIQVYDVPAAIAESVVTSIEFTPVNSKTYEGQLLPAPKGIRWGCVTCVRRDFADLLGTRLDLSAEKTSVQLRNGAVIREWIPIFVRNRLHTPIGQKDDAKSVVELLNGKAISCSSRYSMIFPEESFRLISGFNFKGARVTVCRRG